MISAVSGRERGGPGGPPLDKREKHGRIKVKREPYQQAVSPIQDRVLADAKKPSLVGVAVSAFYDNRDGEPPDMERNPHGNTPFRVV